MQKEHFENKHVFELSADAMQFGKFFEPVILTKAPPVPSPWLPQSGDE